MRRYEIRVELDERFDAADVRLDLRTNRLHPLHKHDLHIAVSHCGSAVIALTLTAADLWSAILTTMALVHHCGYVPSAVEASAMTGGLQALTDLSQDLNWP
ncbi:MAG TPA: hypothetical protein VF086_02970 [Propionibacteriaceae bacterium]